MRQTDTFSCDGCCPEFGPRVSSAEQLTRATSLQMVRCIMHLREEDAPARSACCFVPSPSPQPDPEPAPIGTAVSRPAAMMQGTCTRPGMLLDFEARCAAQRVTFMRSVRGSRNSTNMFCRASRPPSRKNSCRRCLLFRRKVPSANTPLAAVSVLVACRTCQEVAASNCQTWTSPYIEVKPSSLTKS